MFGTKSILLVDGHDEDRWYYIQRLRLASPNCRIFEAATGHVALDLFSSHSIDCVILEIQLPDMSGFELLSNLAPNGEHPKVPIIMFTRLANPHLLDLARMHGAQAAIRKLAASDDILNHTILKAIATVDEKRKDETPPLV